MPHRPKPPIVIRRYLPDLRFSEPLKLDGQPLYGREATWAGVYRKVLQRAMKHFGTLEDLKKSCQIGRNDIVHGERKGFMSVLDTGISARYWNANNTCNRIIVLAKGMDQRLDIMLILKRFNFSSGNRYLLIVIPKEATLLIKFASAEKPADGETAVLEELHSLPV